MISLICFLVNLVTVTLSVVKYSKKENPVYVVWAYLFSIAAAACLYAYLN